MLTGRKQRAAGLALIVVGLGLLALKLAGPDHQDLVLLGIGACFLAGHAYTRQYGLLVPGAILTGLGLGQILAPWLAPLGDPSQLGLGAGFIAIFLVSRLTDRKAHWWPLIPGVILLAVAMASKSSPLGRLIANQWPLALALIGVYLYWHGSRSRGADPDADPS